MLLKGTSLKRDKGETIERFLGRIAHLNLDDRGLTKMVRPNK